MSRTCFVVGPIGDKGTAVRGHADWLLDEIIAPVFAEHFKDFDVVRSDRIAAPGVIDSQVINNLLDAELVIADLSFEARNALKEAIEAVLDKDYKVENPVTRARGYAEVSKHAMPGQEVILAEIDSLRREVQAAAMSAASAETLAQLALNPSRSFASGLAPFLQTGGGGFASGVSGGGGAGIGFAGGGGTTMGSGDMHRGVASDPPLNRDTPLVLRESEKKKKK